MTKPDLKHMLSNHRLTTAEILYHFPDHPSLLQTYLWQEMDIPPKFPILLKFIDFWERKLEGKLHSITVTNTELIQPTIITPVDGIWTIQ